MRKFALLISLFFINVFCFAADYRVTKDSKIYDGDYNFEGILRKDTIVQLWDCSIRNQKDNDKLPFDYSVRIRVTNQKRLIDYNSLIPLETKELFDEEIVSNNLEMKELYWTTTTVLDILKSNTRDTYYKLFQEKIESYEQRRGVYDKMEWYEGVCFNENFIYNISLVLSDDIKYSFYYYIKKIEKTLDGYLVTCELNDLKIEQISYTNDKLEVLRNQEEITYRFIRDGDYLYINSMDNQLLFTYVLVNASVPEQYETLFQKGKADLSKVTWPRHADGTCDYDGSSKKVTTANTSQPKTSEVTKAGSNTNVAVKKTMTTNCNLKLRSGEATSTQVLTVMSAGTKVKILELGKAETIDGINSNWVRVEVQSDAKDRDGKPIKAGTVGWCYGGYLE